MDNANRNYIDTDTDAALLPEAIATEGGNRKGRRAGVVYQIWLAGVRKRLPPRNEPYYYRLQENRFIGYRKSPKTGEETWAAKMWRDEKNITYKLGRVTKDNNYEAAKAKAESWFSVRACVSADLDTRTTVEQALLALIDVRTRKSGGTLSPIVALAIRRIIKEDAKFAKAQCLTLTTARIEEWRAGLVYVRGKSKGQPLNKVTQDRYMSYVRSALNLVGRKSPTLRAELSAVKDHGERNRRTIVLEIEQARAWIAAAPAGINDLIEGTLRMGCRPGDLPRMRRSDYDQRQHQVRLTTKKATRWVPLPPAAIPLMDRLAAGRAEAEFLFRRPDGSPWPLGVSDWTDEVSAAARAAGLPPGCCLYTLRHTFITCAINDGLNVNNIAKLCGTSLRMIEKHYQHLLNKEGRALMTAVNVLGDGKRSSGNVIAFPAPGTPGAPANPAAVKLARMIARLPVKALERALASMPIEALAHMLAAADEAAA